MASTPTPGPGTQGRRLVTYDVFVGSLPKDVDQKRIGKVFSQFGEIFSIYINNGGGFAFVKYYCEEDCLKAIEDLNGKPFEGGQPLKVNRATKSRGGFRKDGGGDSDSVQDIPEIKPQVDSSTEMQPKKDLMRVLVTHVETPVVMWGQKVNEENAAELSSISEQLASICPEAPKITEKPDTEKIYGALYSEDNQWYRCIVKYSYGGERVKIQYIDFGNTEEVNPNTLVELPKILTSLPPCAIKFMLHSLYSTSNHDQTAIQFLKNLVDNQEVEVFTTARLSDHTGFYAEVYANDVNVCEKMVEGNYCFKKPGLDRGFKVRGQAGPGDMATNRSQTELKLQQKKTLKSEEPMQFNKQKKLVNPSKINSPSEQTKKMLQSFENHSQVQEKFVRNEGGSVHNKNNSSPKSESYHIAKSMLLKSKVNFGVRGQGDGNKKYDTNSAKILGNGLLPIPKEHWLEQSKANGKVILHQKGNSVMIKNSKDVSNNSEENVGVSAHNASQQSDSLSGAKLSYIMSNPSRKFDNKDDETANYKWKLKTLQTEYLALSNKYHENDLPKQLETLQNLACDVRKLRKQFPFDADTPLDAAISLLQSPYRISMDTAPSITEVLESIEAYRTAQNDILNCSDKAILKEKTQARDEMRRNLFGKLEVSMEEIRNLPLSDRGKQVQDVVAALSKNYDNFSKIPLSSKPTLEAVLPAYENWKTSKKEDVISARRQSDSYESSIKVLFSQIQTQLCLLPDIEESPFPENLLSTLKNYEEILKQEITVWNSDSAHEQVMMASLVQVLLQDLSQESDTVIRLNQVMNEFSSMKDGIAQWLNEVPNLDKLTETRKKLKSLKSKLRHKLADKMDAEENQDAEELEVALEELEIIRSKIHKALSEEDNIMGEISKLAGDHFPELLNVEQDTGLATYLKYSGLVKESHSPDHYTMTPVGGSSTGMYNSVYDEEPVLIKEYFLSDGNHLSKEEFLQKLQEYTKVFSPQLQKVEAVFFDKNNRHAYVMVKKEGELLSTLVEQSVLRQQQIHLIVQSVCVGLQALHFYNVGHGQVQPDFIMVDDANLAKLLPPDFSLAELDRCRSKYVTESNLEMSAPEIKQQHRSSTEHCFSNDIYCLGLIALWLHHPNVNFSEKANGVVDIASVQLDRNLGIFLTKLLSYHPHMRPTAENCLKSEYLSRLPAEQTTAPSQIYIAQSGKRDSCGSSASDLARNSASPGSSSGGYADNGNGAVQMINTRYPPPPLSGGGDMSPAYNPNPSPQLTVQQQNIQQQLIQQQLQQQQMQQRHQQQQYQFQQQMQQQALDQLYQQSTFQSGANSGMSVPVNNFQTPGPNPTQTQNGTFEIGTFDPNAYEVVSSPQPSAPSPADFDGLENLPSTTQPEDRGQSVETLTADDTCHISSTTDVENES